MKPRRIFFALLLLLASAVCARAQWSGNVDAKGGIGLMKSFRGQLSENFPKYLFHALASGSASLQYQDSVFMWTTRLEAGYEPNNMDYVNADLLYGDGSEVVQADGIVRLSHQTETTAAFRTAAIWPSLPKGRVSTWLQYAFSRNDAYNVNSRFNELGSTAAYADDQEMISHVFGTGVDFTRKLSNPRLSLSGNLLYNHAMMDQASLWATIHVEKADPDYWTNMFRVTPHTVLDNLTAVLHVADSVLTGKTKLVLDPGMRISWASAINENSGGTAEEYLESLDESTVVWRDSSEIREHFHFMSLDMQPYLVADLIGSKLRIHADYAPVFYGRKLTDSTHHQLMRFQRPYVVGNGSATWQMAKGHKLHFTNSMSVRHPSYLQVCWYDRTGGYIDRLYRGNPQLKSNVSRSYGLEYAFNYKRFNTSTSFSFSRSRNIIVQTWFEEEIERRHYKVFTWVNGAESQAYGISQKIGWQGKVLTANAGVDFNHTHQVFKETEEMVEANDWSLYADIGLAFGKGWSVSADMRYQSEVMRFFSLFSDYCLVNAKVTKRFKSMTLFLEGRHLADKAQITKIYSDSDTKLWTEQTYLNRRLILLGLSWRF